MGGSGVSWSDPGVMTDRIVRFTVTVEGGDCDISCPIDTTVPLDE